jgi:hypothetical protein
MSWNDYELNRRSLEMKSTGSLFADKMRRGDLDGMEEMAKAMKRTAQMARLRVKQLKKAQT